MELLLNTANPTLVHIDLNSCFATIEQQANPLLRGKPMVVAAYDSPRGCVLAASIEAKRLGIKTGDRVGDAKKILPTLIVRTPDPDKYFYVHERLIELFRTYTSKVHPKSIDEAVLDFRGTKHLSTGLIQVAKDIKKQIKSQIGEWLTVSIGIAPNRFLAKLGSGLHKPDGLDMINYQNLRAVYDKVTLLDLPGINVRLQARLNAAGIFTPLQFLATPTQRLEKEVFGGISGYYWSMRLTAHEIDSIDFARRSFGQEYALGKQTADKPELSRLLFKLCEKMGRRLRKSGFSARGIHLALSYHDSYVHTQRMQSQPMHSTKSLFLASLRVLNEIHRDKRVVKIAVCCYELVKEDNTQLEIFDIRDKELNLTKALDDINDTFGEFCISPALMMGMDNLIIKRVAFGKVNQV